MKIAIQRPALSSVLKAASDLFPKQSYSSVWLKPNETGCTVSASDGQLSIEERVAAVVTGISCQIPLPIAMSMEWLANLPHDADEVAISDCSDATIKKISMESGSNKIFITPLNQPDAERPEQQYAERLAIDSSIIKRSLDFSAGDERPELCGVNFGEIAGVGYAFTSTGTVYCQSKLGEPVDELFLPKTLADLAVAMRGAVVISMSERGIQLKSGARKVFGPQRAGGMSPWRRTLGQLQFPATCRVLTEDLRAAIRACHCLRGGAKYIPTKFDCSSGSLVLSAESAGGQTEVRLAGKVSGSAAGRYVPSEQLLRFFNHSSDELTVVEFGDTGMPIQLRSKKDSFVIGAVPMRGAGLK